MVIRVAERRAAPLEQLDLATVIKVSQAVAGEIVLEKLLDTIMRAAIEHAGAARALLILSRQSEHRIAAEATSSSETVRVRLCDEPVNGSLLPETVLHSVLHTRESVVLDDAAIVNPFSADSYLGQRQARSVLCVPLTNQARLIGVLYLENHLAPGVFAPTRLAVLKLLAAQAAISLDHNRLYRDLGERERESRTIVDGIPGMVALLTPGGDVEVVNRQLIEYFGQGLEQLRQWKITDTVHPADLAHVVEAFTRSIASGSPYEIVQRFRRSDGVYRWFLNCGLPVRDPSGQIARWCVLLTDIDERKRAEDALRASEGNLQLIIDTIPALAWSARPDGSAEFFNQHYLDFIGVSAEAAGGWGWTSAVHPDDLNELAVAWQRILASQEAGEAEARLRHYGGAYRWFLFRTNPLRDETGAIVKWYGINTDIEDRKRAEAELGALKDQLYKENLVLRDEVDRTSMFEEIVGTSPALRPVLARVAKVAADRFHGADHRRNRHWQGARRPRDPSAVGARVPAPSSASTARPCRPN